MGSILGPLIFLIFINDMTFSSCLKSVLFADYNFDLAFSKFKTHFSNVFDWILYNKLHLNWPKTKWTKAEFFKVYYNYT